MPQVTPEAGDDVATALVQAAPAGSFGRLFMTISTLTRMGVGLVVLIFLARQLGPERYGLFATVMAYGYLASLLTDFGLPIKTLRDVAAYPDQAPLLMARAVTLKLWLVGVVVLAGGVTILLMPLDAQAKISSLMIVLAVLVGSVGDLIMVGMRAVNRFAAEAKVVLWTSALHLVVVGLAALLYPDPAHVGAAFLASRLIYLIAAWLMVQQQFGRSMIELMPLANVRGHFKDAGWWAADSGLSYLCQQIDGPVLAQVLGLTAAGVYQSGNRFVQAGLAISVVLTNVHVPRLAGSAATTAQARMSREWRIFAEFVGLGALGAAALLIVGPLISRFLLGSAYAAVDQLWPGFAAFLVARYLGAALGTSLAARALPATRVAAQLCGLLVLAAGFTLVLPQYGIVAAPWIMTAGSAVIVLIYAGALFRLNRRPI